MKKYVTIIFIALLGFGLLSLIAVPIISPQNTSEFNETIISTWNHYEKRDVNWNSIPLSAQEKQINHTYYSSQAVSDSTEIVYCKWLGSDILEQDTLYIHEFENSNGYSFVYMENALGDTFTISSYFYDSLDINPFNYTATSEVVRMARQTFSTSCPCKSSVAVFDRNLDNDLMLIRPNPINDFIVIDNNLEDFQDVLVGSIYSLDGRVVNTFAIESNVSKWLDVSSISNGIYVVVVEDDNGFLSAKKIVIQ
ncbi:MAG: T9SS type A sorting domain-containing protein [Chitinophagales bacterium]